MKRGHDLLFDWIETAGFFGDAEESWCALEMAHWFELRRYEPITATKENVVASLYCDIFLDGSVADPLKLSSEIRAIYLNTPHLLMDDRWEAVLIGILDSNGSAA